MSQLQLPIDLPLRTVTTKVSVGAWERAQALKEKHGVRLSDIVSAALLHIGDAQLEAILNMQKRELDKLPKVVRGVLRNADKMTDADRQVVIDALSGPPQK